MAKGPKPKANVDVTTEIDPSVLLDLSADDEGNAQSVLRLYPGAFLYIEEIKNGWVYYTGTHWSMKGAKALLTRAITETLKARRLLAVQHDREAIVKKTSADTKLINPAREMLQHILTCSIDEFDTDPDLLNCRNGVLNLRTGKLAPHSPTQRFTYVLPVDYDADADYSTWERFLSENIEDAENVLPFLKQAIGYSLTGHTREEKLFYVFGPERAGKGTFSETMLTLLGSPLSTGFAFEVLTKDRSNDTNKADLAVLKPCRFIVASESNRHTSLNPAVIKSVTGGDHLFVAFKYGVHFSYRPKFKIWLTSNWPVNTDVDDDAAWSRLHIITFPNSHKGKEDKTLKDRLKTPESLRGVLAWAVEGAMQWYGSKCGLQAPDSVKANAQKHRDELDTVGQFLAESVSDAPGELITNSAMYTAYESWCKENGVTPRKQRSFTMSLNRKGYEQKHARVDGKLQRCWADCELYMVPVEL